MGILRWPGMVKLPWAKKVIMKGSARKVRRIYDNKVVVGFAGSVADAFNLEDRFEKNSINIAVTYNERLLNWHKNGVAIKLCKNLKPY